MLANLQLESQFFTQKLLTNCTKIISDFDKYVSVCKPTCVRMYIGLNNFFDILPI